MLPSRPQRYTCQLSIGSTRDRLTGRDPHPRDPHPRDTWKTAEPGMGQQEGGRDHRHVGQKGGRTSPMSGQGKCVSPRQRQTCLQFFNNADKSGVGQITVHQFRDTVLEMGFLGSTYQIAEMFADLRPNDDLVLTEELFMAEMCKADGRRRTRQQTEEVFNSLDVDGDGLITKEDIMASLLQRDKFMSEENIHKIILKNDYDRDGAINLNDFTCACQRK